MFLIATNLVVLTTILFVDNIKTFIYTTYWGVIMRSKNFDVWLAIGLNILHYRKEQGLTQMQLAEKANMSSKYLQRIETATSSCTLDTLIDIAEALDIPLKKLFEFRD